MAPPNCPLTIHAVSHPIVLQEGERVILLAVWSSRVKGNPSKRPSVPRRSGAPMKDERSVSDDEGRFLLKALVMAESLPYSHAGVILLLTHFHIYHADSQ